jgi:hypothetical protein
MTLEIALVAAAALFVLLALGVLIMRQSSQMMVGAITPKGRCGFMPPA